MKRISPFIPMLAVWLAANSLTASAAGGPAVSADRPEAVTLSIDAVSFRYNADSALVEVAFSIPRRQAVYIRTPEGVYKWSGGFDLSIRSGDSLLSERQWRSEDTLADTSGIRKNLDFTDVIRFLLKPGSYKAVLNYRDGQAEEWRGEAEADLIVPDYPEDRPCLSQVRLASKVTANFQERNHPFFKNSLQVVPNPKPVYSEESPFLYYYAELYGLTGLAADSGYVLETAVQTRSGAACRDVEPGRKVRAVSGESAVEWGAVRVGLLPNGSYRLVMRLLRHDGAPLDERTAVFFVYRPGAEGSADPAANPLQLYLSSEFGGMGEAELNDEFEHATYLMRKNERKEFKALSGEAAKGRWLFEFWRKLDSDPRTLVNETRLDYLRRIQIANQRYRSFQNEGWETERGRVFLLYGDPTSTMSYPNEQGMRPYEVWYYDEIESGVQFVFVDFNMDREFRLVHSNKRGELANQNWQDMARKGQF
jgi:GWxTD domain-containing protein